MRLFSPLRFVAVNSIIINVTLLSFNLLFPHTTYASSQADVSQYSMLTEVDYLDVVPVVLSATRLAQPIDAAPAAITIITKKMIDASGAQEIGDLLRLVPGFQVGYFNGISMSMSYHGFSGNYDRRLQVLIDGRSVYMPLLSTVEWLSLPLDISEVEKIEVVRSSNTPVYGTNSFKGVINIITRKPFQDLGARVNVTVGSYDLGRSRQLVGDGAWKSTAKTVTSRKSTASYANYWRDVDYRITLGYQEDTGFDEVVDSKNLSLLRFVGGYQRSASDRFEFQVGIRAGDMDVFAGGDAKDPNRKKVVKSSYESLAWVSTQSNGDELSIRLYRNIYEQNDGFLVSYSDILGSFDPPIPLALLSTDGQAVASQRTPMGVYFGVAERFDVELQYTKKIHPQIRSVMTAGARLDRIKSLYILSSNSYKSDRSVRAAAHLEWYITDWLILNSGLMVERNEQIGTYYSPRMALNSKVSDHHMFRISATRAFRTPSIQENNINLQCCYIEGVAPEIPIHVSAGNLKAEKLDSVELGYIYLPRQNGVTFDSKIFWEKITDGILEAVDRADVWNPWIWGNYTSAELHGIESQLSFLTASKSLFHLTHSYLHANAKWFKNINSDDDSKFQDISDSVPTHTISMLASYQLSSTLSWSFSYYWMSKINWLQDGSRLPQQDRLDTKLSWVKKLSTEKKFEISLILQNIIDDYAEVQDETIFEQRGFLSVTYGW